MQTYNKYFEGRNPSQLTEFNQSYRGLFYAGLVVLLALLGGCGGGSDGTSTSTTSSTTTATGGGTSTGTSTSTSTSTSQPTTTTSTTSSTSQPPATTNTSYKLVAKEDYNNVNAVDRRTVYESNSDGNITKWQRYGSTGKLESQGNYYYGTSGSLLGKLIREEWDDPFNGVVDSIVTYSYTSDAKGNVTITRKDQGGYFNGRVTTIVTDSSGKVLTDLTGNYQYNNSGKLVKLSTSWGGTRSYSYDVGGKLTDITSSGGTYIFGVNDGPSSFTFLYDNNNRLTQLNLRSAWKDTTTKQAGTDVATSDYRYDTKGKVFSAQSTTTNHNISGTASDKKRAIATNITYDTAGNIVQVQRNFASSSGNSTEITKYVWQQSKGWSGKELFAHVIDEVYVMGYFDETCLSVVRTTSPEEKLFTDMFNK